MSRARVRAYRRGLFAETVAALLFRLKGYRVVARRYKTPLGEIDLMALKGQTSCVHRGEGAPESGKCGADPADVAAAAYRARRAILALKPPPNFAGYAMAFDVELDAPWRRPHHVAGAFRI